VENKHFVKLCSDLRPGYKPPSRKKLGNELLNSVHDEVCKDMKRNILEEGKTITLMQDGWSNIHNDPIIAHSIYNGKKAYILSITDTGSAKKTSEYCADLAKEAIKEVKDNYDFQVSNIAVKY